MATLWLDAKRAYLELRRTCAGCTHACRTSIARA